MSDVPVNQSFAEPANDTADIARVASLLGGFETLNRTVATIFDAHDLIVDGLPSVALHHLIGRLDVIQTQVSLDKAIGISVRTFQRQKETPKKMLSTAQSGRTWTFAHILAKATMIFGSQAEAEQWLIWPAIGLNQHCPLDLLNTPAGLNLVEEFLEQLRYGVYV